MLEDKYFSTWYHKRTVLMGDACHKHLPFGGQGANQAILDSVHLVNQLYGIPSNSLSDIGMSFRAYYENRSGNAKEVYKSTSMVATILSARVS
jgi:2-polyprenyl-6-methoxyphenol hydroxylase-like FAD-dependent oxidoreductase